MPSYRSVMLWLEQRPAFSHMYARAKEAQADFMADQIVEISDDATPEDVQVAKLRVDARKFVAMKLKPRKYGERVMAEHSGPEGGAIPLTVPNLVSMSDEQLRRFAEQLDDDPDDQG